MSLLHVFTACLYYMSLLHVFTTYTSTFTSPDFFFKKISVMKWLRSKKRLNGPVTTTHTSLEDLSKGLGRLLHTRRHAWLNRGVERSQNVLLRWVLLLHTGVCVCVYVCVCVCEREREREREVRGEREGGGRERRSGWERAERKTDLRAVTEAFIHS